MKRGDPFDSAGTSKRTLSDVTTAPNNNQTGPPNLQHNLNGDNRLPADSRTNPSSTAPSFPYVPYNSNEFYNMDASSSNMMNTYPRMWHPNNMYNYGLSVPNVNSFNNMNGETSGVNTDERPNEAAIRSPSPVVPFSKDNVDDVITKLEDNNLFRDVIQIFQKWLTNGECNRDNYEEFFTLINKSHKQVWRIMMEKTSVKDNMNKEKKEVNQGMKEIAAQHAQQLKLVEYCKKQKVWDQFSKGQRRQLSMCFEEILKSKAMLGTVLSDIEEEEDDDGTESPDSSTDCDEAELAQYQKLSEDADNIIHEIEALQEDVKSTEIEEVDTREKNKVIVVEHSANLEQLTKEANELKDYKQRTSSENASEPQVIPKVVPPVQHSNLDVSPDEFRLLSTLSIFLHTHPTGASLDYMSSYAMAINVACNIRRLESLLQMYPDAFIEKSVGIGCNMRKVWIYAGFTYFKKA